MRKDFEFSRRKGRSKVRKKYDKQRKKEYDRRTPDYRNYLKSQNGRVIFSEGMVI
jgi:hypothetical protein